VSRYQKGKTNLDFIGARDSEWQWHQLGDMQVCTSLQTDKHASTSLQVFLQAGCPSFRPTNNVKALKAQTDNHASTCVPLSTEQFHCAKQLIQHPFNGFFSRTTGVSQYQKGKTSPELTEARDDGVWDAVASAGPYVNDLHLAPDR